MGRKQGNYEEEREKRVTQKKARAKRKTKQKQF